MENSPIPIRLEKDPFISEQEEIEAAKLTSSNIQFIKNLLVDEVNDLISLQTDPTNDKDYFVKVARIKGNIEAYSHIINSHNAAYAITNQGN